MAEPSALKTRFLDIFRLTTERLQIERSDGIKGQAAVAEIFDMVAEPLTFAPVLSPYYAGHDLQHPIRLAGVVDNLITTNPPSNDSPVRRIECLVLLFSSLLLHDVGMALMGQDLVERDWDEIWHGHLVRPKHDEKSLLFIENVLIPNSDHLHAWCLFWKDKPAAPTPTPTGKWPLFLVARVCQSHGDEADRWMLPRSLDYYTPALVKHSDELEEGFEGVWADAWPKLRDAAQAAAAILSFVDLCDIAADRFPRPGDNELLKRIVPKEDAVRRTSFLHWIGHRVGRVIFAPQIVRFEVRASRKNKLRLRIPFNSGPGAELLKWGNMPQLKAALQDFAGISLLRVEGAQGSVDEEAWEEIESELDNHIFRECWPFRPINEFIHNSGKSPLDSLITAPRWWDAVASDVTSNSESMLFPLYFLAHLRSSGLLIEDCLKPQDSYLPKVFHTTAVVYVNSDETDLHTWYVGDSFAAAILLAREWMSSDLNLTRLRIAVKGDALHRDLRDGLITPYKQSIILVAIARRNHGVLGEYLQIARNILRNSEESVRVIFFGGDKEAVNELREANVSSVEFRISNRRLIALKEYTASADVAINFSDTGANKLSLPYQIAASPTEILFKLYFQEQGSSISAERILDLLQRNSQEEVGQALGVVLFFSLYELLDVTRTGVPDEVLIQEYENMRVALAGGLLLPTLHAVYPIVAATKLIRVSEGTVAVGEPHDAVGVVLIQIAKRSATAFLLQLAVLFRLQSTGHPYNINSPLFASSLPLLLTSTTIHCIFDEAISLDFRITIGFGLAERIASNLHALRPELYGLVEEVAQRTGDLRGEGDFIGFQIIYRLIRSLWIRDLLAFEVERLVSLRNPIVNLGILEALASESASSAEAVRAADLELLGHLSEFFVDLFSGADAVPVTVLMAYDIVWHYRRSPLLSQNSKLFELGANLGWDSIASHFHEEAEVLDVREGSEEVVSLWKEMRRTFLRILEETPVSMKREKAADFSRDRAT